ncbi:Clp protease N-terminal domain-containing protein [Leifsonia sp. RAF41]|uniref:Clp protease N-terminal domain-containing protein n=1 Tax=Leifsonia sp. RAF41 TaxID=3233056 RepID=UPI003F9E9215
MSETPDGSTQNVPGQPLSRALRPVIIRSVTEAQQRSSATVEAEHLLLALSRDGSPSVRTAFADAGLDPDGLEAALAGERAASLRVAGVTPPPAERLAAAPRVTRPRWGASAREALVRAHRTAAANRRQRSGELDLLAAILGLELGTVPRLLTLAGVDREGLLASARRAA